MTTAASPIVTTSDLSRERSISNASKHHSDYQQEGRADIAEQPRSIAMSIDYTTNTQENSNNSNGYSETYTSESQQQQQDQAQYLNSSSNGYHHHHHHHSSSSAYQANGTYLPHPIQTTTTTGGQAFENGGNGSSNGNGVHSVHGGHSSSANTFVSPTSPAPSSSPLSPINTHNLYQQQQYSHYDYNHSQQNSSNTSQYQQQPQSYYAHHAQYPQEHHQHPLSPTADGNSHYDYSGYPIPINGNNNSGHDGSINGNGLSNGSYSSSSSSSHYPRNHSYNYHHGSMDEQTESPNMATGDNIAAYGSSAHSPTSETMISGPRSKRRSEVFAAHESPYFFPAHQLYKVMSMDRSTSYNLKLAAKIDRGFFLASNDWTCYRRNYFQISACFFIPGLDTSQQPEVPCLLDYNGELRQVNRFLICIGAQIQNGEKEIELVQHTPKRDKGPQITPKRLPVRAGGDLSPGPTGLQPYVVTYERVQFKTATANNGKRRAAQQYYQVHVDLFAETDTGTQILVANAFSAPLVVRGRSPGHYADNEEDNTTAAGNVSSGPGTSSSTPYPGDERYPPTHSSYRNDSLSSSNGGDYPYYPSYGYNSSSYQYQSLGSASHMATQEYREDYHYNNNNRHNSESYPASPLSPSGPHPHAYMTPQVQHGFSPSTSGAASPDMYSPSGFPENGGHYQYGSPTYPHFPQQHPQDQHHHYHQNDQQQQNGQYNSYNGGQQYDHDDHEAQLAGLRIHSPVSPGSPLIGSPLLNSGPGTPRRQSFSSALSSSKKVGGSAGDRNSIGSTRKMRSTSMSGITKRAPSKTRTSRTVPATPTKEYYPNGVLGNIGGVLGNVGSLGNLGGGGKGLGISSDRIPESPMEEQQA